MSEPKVTIERAKWPLWFVEVWWPEPPHAPTTGAHGAGTWTWTKRNAARWARRTIQAESAERHLAADPEAAAS